jgi:hypothetical protein
MLTSKVNAALPGKFLFTWNEADILKATVPAGEGFTHPDTGVSHLWRKGAFEVMRKDTGEVLYSKKEEGSHLVDGKGGPEGKLGQFVDFLTEI